MLMITQRKILPSVAEWEFCNVSLKRYSEIIGDLCIISWTD